MAYDSNSRSATSLGSLIVYTKYTDAWDLLHSPGILLLSQYSHDFHRILLARELLNRRILASVSLERHCRE